jgi:DNA adenine methylase
MKIKNPFKIDSKKHHVAQTIIDSLPSNYQELNYCEPFCLGNDVIFNKEKSKEETLNDLDCTTLNIFRVLRDEPKEFIGRLKKIKNLEKTFLSCQDKKEYIDDLEFAYNEFILRKMSRAGQKKSFSISEDAWNKTLEDLPKISTRIKDVIIICQKPEKVVEMWNSEESLIYIDAPCEESDIISLDEHIKILNLVKISKAKVIISGHPSTLYNRMLKGWKQIKKTSNDKSKTEIVWKNF